MHNFKELKIWTKSVELAVEVYHATSCFPKEEMYGIASQTRRSAVSIPSDISEGAGRNSNKEFVHFLGIANGSSNELYTQLIISHRLGLLKESSLSPLILSIDEIQKMNYGFQNALKVNKF